MPCQRPANLEPPCNVTLRKSSLTFQGSAPLEDPSRVVAGSSMNIPPDPPEERSSTGQLSTPGANVEPSQAPKPILTFPPRQVILKQFLGGHMVYAQPIHLQWDMYYTDQISEDQVTPFVEEYNMDYPLLPVTVAVWLALRTHDDALQILHVLLGGDHVVPKVDYQYMYICMLEESLNGVTPNLSFAYFTLRGQLKRNQRRLDKMVLEVLLPYNDSIQVPDLPLSTTNSFIRNLNGSPDTRFLHSLNRSVILEDFPLDMRTQVIERLQEKRIEVCTPFHQPQLHRLLNTTEIERQIAMEPGPVPLQGDHRSHVTFEGVSNSPNFGNEVTTVRNRSVASKGRPSFSTAFTEGIAGPVAGRGSLNSDSPCHSLPITLNSFLPSGGPPSDSSGSSNTSD
ncbi:hypothetical protein BU17DRAFT_93602 [Hysterangium stoloniferum]|nr:hypothetical protein BU17DRAFT_93602 [Hysterangium stoloniferum]